MPASGTSEWAARRTHHWTHWRLPELLDAKRAAGLTVSLVVPARNEAGTVGTVVSRVRDLLLDTHALLDELVVIDSDSTDDTFDVATDAGAKAYRAADIRPDLGTAPGKGEAMWKSLFVTAGDVLVFMDADLVDWDTHFVPGLLGPLLTDPSVLLTKGFYERPLLTGDGGSIDGGSIEGGPIEGGSREGGRVTELVARPLIALRYPELSGLVQPLAGEWAVRREHFAGLSVPTGYAVELAALVDTVRQRGVDAIAQVDLGRRAHRHQPLLDLGAMATQLLACAERRGTGLAVDELVLRQPDGVGMTPRAVRVDERPPAAPYLTGAA